jgi:uncharacterized cupin superfamily protein
MTDEARLEETGAGLAPAGDGWFVMNVGDALWLRNDYFGAAGVFEGDEKTFPEVGFTLGVLWPGQPNGLYHSESNQEDFLVLAGECVLLVEEEERRLRAWDFVHCPAGTEHIFVGAGDGPCVIFMTGGRAGAEVTTYPRSELARSHGAGAEAETKESAEAYAPFPKWRRGRPDAWNELPWAGAS